MKEAPETFGPDRGWLEQFIRSSLQEDIGDGDHSSLSCIAPSDSGRAHLLIKEEGVIAGIDLAQAILAHLDPEMRIETHHVDGERLERGDVAFEVEGRIRSMLTGERLLLNCMQRMSGIATTTAAFVAKVADLPVRINDTRKTTPGMRALEKWAVRIGGGSNHRQGLYDMILLKDNHIDHAGGIEGALRSAIRYLEEHQLELPIEVEARDLDEVEQVLKTGKVDRIMLDNFSYAELEKAVQRIGDQAITEASGGVRLDTVRDFAKCGVDRISVGALTHSVPSIDMSLKASG